MYPIVLIAKNFLREQRWLVLVLLAWVFGSSLALGLDDEPALSDAAFFLQQQAMYGVAFGAFLAASAIHNERRSRRILSVLSKGVERRHYLAGLLLGVGAVELIYALAMAVGALWTLRGNGVEISAVVWLLATLLVAAMLVASIAMFFSTFLNPLVALAATGVTAALPLAVSLAFPRAVYGIVPVYPLIAFVLNSSLHESSPVLGALALAAAQVILFWIAGAWMFARRDIAAAIE
ncbi:MAG: hypothetical protein AB7O65_07640 [Candidatus Korobacteraceae bacterium]